MTTPVNVTTGCLLVGEYIDEAECPTDLAFHRGDAVRPQVVANFLDLWGRDDGRREFTVLLKDGRIVVVRGHGLKIDLPRSNVFSIVDRIGEEEVTVALFKDEEVSGIFSGELRPDRKIA